MKVAVIGTVLAAGLACTNARATTITTNVVFNFTVSLSGVQHGLDAKSNNVVLPFTLGNKDILRALNGLVSGITTNHFVNTNGSPVNGAKLILNTTIGVDTIPVVKVRQSIGTNVVDTDLSTWLNLSQRSQTVEGSAFHYNILGLTLTNALAGSHFNVQGYFTESKGALVGAGKAHGVKLFNATTGANGAVAGDGNLPEVMHATDTYSILHGSVAATGPTIEIH